MASAAHGDSGLVADLLASRPDLFGPVLPRAADYEIQILYTQIDRDADNVPRFNPHAYRLDADAYFYPASAIKLAAALLALEKINRLAVDGLDKFTPLRIDSAAAGQVGVVHDATAPGRRPSIAHYIRKLFAVSDNDAYNRLYEFVGQQALNESLWAKGYTDVRLTHRLQQVLPPEQNRLGNPFEFYAGQRVLYRQGLLHSPLELRAPAPILKGTAHLDSAGQRRDESRDFAGSNFMSLQVLQDLLRAVLFPESVAPECRFDLSADDRSFIYRCLSVLPRESRHPAYDPARYYDSYVKFFLFGDTKDRIPNHLRLFNKVGLAYGYMIDNAYIVDLEEGVEFLLSAVISTNENGVFDGEYAYDQVGFPFLANLGRVVYDYERQRKRQHAPDLSRFKIEYAAP